MGKLDSRHTLWIIGGVFVILGTLSAIHATVVTPAVLFKARGMIDSAVGEGGHHHPEMIREAEWLRVINKLDVLEKKVATREDMASLEERLRKVEKALGD